MSTNPERLGNRSRSLLLDNNNELFLSIVSVWEMILKNAIGKLDLPIDVQSFVRRFLPVSQCNLLDLSLDHVFALGRVSERHRDPFDRMLVAQAHAEGMSLLSADPDILSYPIASLDARQ